MAESLSPRVCYMQQTWNTGDSSSIDSLVELLRTVRAQDPSLQHIVLERRRLPPWYIQALARAIVENKYVTKLRLCRVGVDDTAAEALSDCLRRSKSLFDVDLSRNRLTGRGAKVLAKALQEAGRRSEVRRLNLEGNHIDDDGIQAICLATPRTKISVLRLGKNRIGLAGIHSVAHMLRQESAFCPLVSLCLRSNKLGNEGAMVLADALEDNTTLQFLYLSRTEMNNAGAERLALALTRNQHLRTLDLRRNLVSDKAAQAFVAALQCNDYFTKLKIRHTAVSDAVKRELLELLIMNSYGPDLARQTKQALLALKALESVPIADKTFDGSTECIICFDSLSDCALLPCKHFSCCQNCAQRLKECHLCRSPIVNIFPMDPLGSTASASLDV